VRLIATLLLATVLLAVCKSEAEPTPISVKIVAYVAQMLSHNPNHIVVSAGDLVGASPLTSAAYHDEGTIEALNLLGLELSCVGNHEFDAGPNELLRKQAGGCFEPAAYSCLEHGRFPGASFKPGSSPSKVSRLHSWAWC